MVGKGKLRVLSKIQTAAPAVKVFMIPFFLKKQKNKKQKNKKHEGEIIMQKGFIFILILAIIIGIFAISNNAVVPINFVFTEVLLSQAIVIFICVLLGAIIASLFGAIRQLSLNKTIKHIKTEKEELEARVYELEEMIEEKDNDIKVRDQDIEAKQMIINDEFVDHIDQKDLF